MPAAIKTTFTLLMLTRCPVMKETEATVFCQSERGDHIDRIADAMRAYYVVDFQVVTKQGRRTTHGPILRSHKHNECPRCRRQYTYNDLQEAREAGLVEYGDLACECGCTFMVDWQFTGKEGIVLWDREAHAAAAREKTAKEQEAAGGFVPYMKVLLERQREASQEADQAASQPTSA